MNREVQKYEDWI